MSNNAELLAAILPEIIANRANLVNQLQQLDQQKVAGELQIKKFDALIASLQVSTGDSAVQALIDTQAGANAIAAEGASSPTNAAPGADGSAAANESATSENAPADTAVA